MAGSSTAGKVVSTALLVTGAVASLVASAYSITLAYMMGASAQADADGAQPADAGSLLRISMAQLVDKIKNPGAKPIDVHETKVHINDVPDAANTPESPAIEAQVVD
ncbi:MAG: hypothetical protein Q4E12_06150 [Coriobacteriia bacterium]|nr:hypothetical protein [Coriobacteriia bacterium]